LKEFLFWYSVSPLVEAKKQFDDHDDDKNGELDRDEFMTLLPHLGMAFGKAEAEKLFKDIDTDRSGNIDKKEFAAWYAKFKTAEKEYRNTDTDNSGEIDVVEFKVLVTKLGVAADSEATNLFAEVDTDKSGNVDLKEFLLWYSVSALVEAKKQFELHDEDGNGALDKAEFAKLLPHLGLKLVEASEAGKLFTDIDNDGNGSIDKNEFAEWYCKFKAAEQEYRDTDTDNSGEIDIEEFKVLMKRLGVADGAEAEKLFKEIDTDASGNVDLKEFVFWFSTSPLAQSVQGKMKFAPPART